MYKKFFLFVIFLFNISQFVIAQKITFSNPGRDVIRGADFDVIGKFNTNYIVYKDVNSSKSISIFDNKMNIIKNLKLNFLPAQILDRTTIEYNDFFYFIYQYQRKHVLTCAAAKIDANGNIIGDPTIIDTSLSKILISSKAYNIVVSENKQKILFYKADVENTGNYIFSFLLYDNQLNAINKFSFSSPIQSNNSFISDVSIDNGGSIAFVNANQDSATSNIYNSFLLIKNPQQESFAVYQLDTSKIFLNNVLLKADNINNHFVVTCLFTDKKMSSTAGIFCALWDKRTQSIAAKEVSFNDDFKQKLIPPKFKTKDVNFFYLQDIILQKNGAFIINGETSFAVSGNSGSILYGSSNTLSAINFGTNLKYTRGPFLSNYVWIPPYSNPAANYYAFSTVVMSFDSTANMNWNSIIPKMQVNFDNFNLIGFQSYVLSGKLNFLFNQPTKKRTLLECVSINAEGKASINPPMIGLEHDYEFMPRYGKQVSSHEILIPCQYRNYFCFAKIEF